MINASRSRSFGVAWRGVRSGIGVNQFHLISSFTDYGFSLSGERHELRLKIDADLDDTCQVHALHGYHLNLLVSGISRMENREYHHGNSHNIAIDGFELMWPPADRLRMTRGWSRGLQAGVGDSAD